MNALKAPAGQLQGTQVQEQLARFDAFMAQANLPKIGLIYLRQGIKGYDYLLRVLRQQAAVGCYTHPVMSKSYSTVLEEAATKAFFDFVNDWENQYEHDEFGWHAEFFKN